MENNKGNKILVGLIVAVGLLLIGTAIFLMLNNKNDSLNSTNKNLGTSVSTSTIKYGDVNDDGKITTKDVSAIQRHVAGTTKLSAKQIKQADVNLNGKVDNNDATLIQKYLSKLVTKLPIKYGDVNGDGKITIQDASSIEKHITGKTKLTNNNLEAADVNLNGKVDNNDVLLIRKYTSRSVTTMPIVYGDVNNDGKITIQDASSIEKHITGKIKLTNNNLEAADVNLDNKINKTDVTLIQNFINKSIKVLPQK